MTYKDKKVRFAEWLAKPLIERNPSTAAELAKVLRIHRKTLWDWRKEPEVQELVKEAINARGADLVPSALSLLEKAVKKDEPIPKTKIDAARAILSVWDKANNSVSIIATIQDLYDKYHTER
ncbi:hypothetical protein ES703_34074 [subsurface metagenome]